MARVRSAEQRAVRLARQYLGKHGVVAVYTHRDPGSMDDVIIVETRDGRRPPGLPTRQGRTAITVRRGGPYRAESFGAGSGRTAIVVRRPYRAQTFGAASVYMGVVRAVLNKLRSYEGSISVTQGLNQRLQAAETRIGAPASLKSQVRAAVADVLQVERRDPHTVVVEGKTSPGAIGEGWYIALIEQSASDHRH